MAIIAIDFDGTIVTHEYPMVGKPVPMAKDVICMLNDNGHTCFLWTMRDLVYLMEAKEYCTEHYIPIKHFNKSPSQFSTSPKQYAPVYIDDAALGCPLNYDPTYSKRPYVDWLEIAKYLTARGLLTQDQLNTLLKH